MPRQFAPGQAAVVVESAIWTMLVIATIFLALRIYCRAVRAGKLWWDDYILTIGWLFVIAASSIVTQIMRDGFADTVMSGADMMLGLRAAHTCQSFSLLFAKMSLAATLLYLSTGWHTYVLWFIIGSTIVVYAIQWVLLWRPMCGAETDHDLPGSCWGTEYASYLNMTVSSKSPTARLLL